MQNIAIEMGGVSRYFSKLSGSGVDLTLLNIEGIWSLIAVRAPQRFESPPVRSDFTSHDSNQDPKNLLRLFFRIILARQKIT